MADKKAKEGGKLSLVEEVGLPKCEIHNKIESFFINAWSKDWDDYPKARMTKLIINGPNKNQSKYVQKLGRLELSRYIKIVTGHNGLFYFKHKIDPQINSTCCFCLQSDETFFHLLTECPRHRSNREAIFLDSLPDFNTNWAVRPLLSFSNLTGIGQALDGDTSLRWFGENWSPGDTSESEDGSPPRKRPNLDDS